MCRFLVFAAVCFTVVAAFSGRLPRYLGDEGGLVDLISRDLYSNSSFTAWTRQRRQTGRCKGSADWQCRDGSCIERDEVCDGAVNCPDRSDETQAVCVELKACASHLYQCTYGACVEARARCNNKLDCADGSDERIKECDTNAARKSTNCSTYEFQCLQGRQCIDKSDVCDGVANCRDKSDETLYQCATNTCPSLYEKCAYGACVDHGARCNNVVNCVDGSDEDPVLCAGVAGWRAQVTSTANSPTTGLGNRHDSADPGGRSCVLPDYPEGGKYIILTNPTLRPRQVVPKFTYLNYSCDNGYDLSTASSPSCDGNNGWGQTPTCKKKCRMPSSFSVNFVCRSANYLIKCTNLVSHGTVVQSKCKREFNVVYSMNDITCNDGRWTDDPPTCKAICGLEKPGATPYAKYAPIAKKNSFPWHVGVYQMYNEEPTYVCGGTILYSNVIISAAHCFYNNGPIAAREFKIAAGKFYKSYDNAEDDKNSWVQKRNVTQIFLRDIYEGEETRFQSDIALVHLSSPFEFSGSVRPICFDLEQSAEPFNRLQIKPGSQGKVAGWGLTESGRPSEELRVLYMPIISIDDCKQANNELRLLVTSDKLCAGHTNGSSLCQGDSGGGLVFPENRTDLEEVVWHLRALVSVGPKEDIPNQCISKTYTAFTKIFDHRLWMIEKLKSLKVLR